MNNTGGPAFPQNDATVNRINNLDGMTLRDYFAAKAMQGMVSDGWLQGGVDHTENIVKRAYRIADSMIHQRSVNIAPLQEIKGIFGRFNLEK